MSLSVSLGERENWDSIFLVIPVLFPVSLSIHASSINTSKSLNWKKREFELIVLSLNIFIEILFLFLLQCPSTKIAIVVIINTSFIKDISMLKICLPCKLEIIKMLNVDFQLYRQLKQFSIDNSIDCNLKLMA